MKKNAQFIFPKYKSSIKNWRLFEFQDMSENSAFTVTLDNMWSYLLLKHQIVKIFNLINYTYGILFERIFYEIYYLLYKLGLKSVRLLDINLNQQNVL